jgi:hypothetical protein
VTIIFDALAPIVNSASFGLGLFDAPVAQPDNVTRIHPATSADLDEETRRSIEMTIAEERASRAAQPDNETFYHAADAASIDEDRAHSIALTLVREEADRRERIMEIEAAKSVYFDRLASLEREIEEAELGARWDSVCYA